MVRLGCPLRKSVLDVKTQISFGLSTLEKVEFEEKFELNNRERFYIENNKCVDRSVPNRTNKEYYEANREK